LWRQETVHIRPKEDKTGPMKNKEELANRAVSLFNSGFNCAESLLLSTAEHLERCTPSIPSVATGFGGGMGKAGSVCGALTGAVLAVGLACGRSRPADDKDRVYGCVRRLRDEFAKEFGTVMCRELTDCDLTTPEGKEKFERENTHEERCAKFVAKCAETVFDMVGPGTPART
jgi:C_GCAxxG_C_C family probable redox protein